MEIFSEKFIKSEELEKRNRKNLFLYHRTMPITIKQFDTLLKSIKKELSQ